MGAIEEEGMRTAFRIVALFASYTAIGFGGDWAVGLLAQDGVADIDVVERRAVAVEVDVPRVVIDVKPSIVTRVQVRHSGECSYEMDRELTLAASGVRVLDIQAGSGQLPVEGQRGLEEIVVLGQLCASDEAYLEEMLLEVIDLSDGVVRLETHYPSERSRRGNNTASIHLTVLVPLGMNVDIDDSSGDMVVSGTGDLNIDDSSGSILVEGIDGTVRIDDSSGGIDLRDVSGDVDVDDSSGGIDVFDVRGSVTVRDGSGGIEISEVDRNVLIESDGSGGIDVSNVAGDFVVERDGNGGIRHSGVEGRVDVPVRRRRGGR